MLSFCKRGPLIAQVLYNPPPTLFFSKDLMHFILKLFPEITIKSKPVRQRFIRQLRDNLKKLIKPIDPAMAIQKSWDRIEITLDTENEQKQQQVIDLLQRTPGICNFLQVIDYEWQGMEDAFEKTQLHYGDQLPGRTFAVRMKRSGQHDFTSADAERTIGGMLKKHCGPEKVSLDNPDVMIRLELRQDRLSIVLNQFDGIGGFPLGTQDGVLSLISGGFDSTVSSYLCTKRGLLTHYCFFNLGGRAHEIGVKEVAVFLWLKYGSSHRVKFITVPFESVIQEILEKIENSQMGVILKRMFLRAASELAEQFEIPALVTGESVAQVSSQTLQNLVVIDSVINKLVLRPLITMDKTDIIHLSQKIGTEEFAAAMPEYCGVISVKPTTRAKPEKIEKEESFFDFSVLQEAINSARAVNIDEIVNDIQQTSEIEQVNDVSAGEIVVDIRHPDEEELKPLELTHGDILKIPFYSLHKQFSTLDKSKHYLLYCEKGVMSQLHGQYLKDEGFENVKVLKKGQ